MINKNLQNRVSPAYVKSLLVLIAVIILNGLVFVPSADAQDCPGGGMFTTGPIDLLSCTEFKPGNSSLATITTPAGLADYDLLVAVVQMDDSGTDATLSITGGGYWTALGAETDARGIISQVYYRLVTNGAGESSVGYDLSWPGGVERLFAYILRFQGASSIFDEGIILDQGNSLTSLAPALTTTVDNTFVLRTMSTDRFPYADDAGTPPVIENTFILINSDNTGDGSGGVGGASGFLEPVAGGVTLLADTWALTGNTENADGTHNRTIGIRPYAEFRIHTEAGINITAGASSQCAVELITLRATDRAGVDLPWFTGTVTLTASNTSGLAWTNTAGQNASFTDNGGGSMTYTFDGSESGVATFQYYNTTADPSIDFGATDSTGTYFESTQGNYTPTPLLIRDCDFVISYGAGDEIGTCGIEQLTISLEDTAGNPATNYSGTMTINNNNGSGAGTYSFVSGSFGGTFNDLDNGQATYGFTITPATGGTPSTVVLDYTHESTTLTNIDFLIGDGSVFSEAAGNPILTVTACAIQITYADAAEGANVLSDTCTPTSVTIEVVDETGAPINGYTGTIRITNDQTIGAWTEAAVTGTLDNSSGGGADNGQADYTFQATENGSKTFIFSVTSDVGPNIDFEIVETSAPTFIISPTGNFDADVDILPCTWDFQVPTAMGTCVSSQAITVTIRSRDTNPVDGFLGQVQIDTGAYGIGSYTLTDDLSAGGLGTLDNAAGGGADNGILTYDFNALDNGQLNLEFATITPNAAVTFALTTVTPGLVLAINGGSQNITAISNCDLVVTLPDANLIRNVCTMTRVSFEVQVGGVALANFDGEVDLTTSGTQGKWFENPLETYPGTLSGGSVGDGTANYDFNGTEGGEVILDFRNAVAVNDLSFSASGTATNGATITVIGVAPEVDIFICTLTITTASATNIADVCRGGESVTYTLSTPGTTDFSGTMSMTTSSGFGNYAKTAGISTLIGPGGNDGAANYTFDPGDLGVLVVDYSVLAVPPGTTATLQATIPDVTVINTDGTLTFRACEFEISFPSDTAPFETDVCSIKQVQIRIVDGAGVPAVVDDYTGTINLTTSTGFGSWAENPADNDGTLTDPFGEDGSASYVFDDLDDGVVLLNFTHTAAAAASLNINVTDSVTSDPGSPGSTFDPNLSVDLCTFQISYDGLGLASTHDEGNITACELQQVTIEVYDSTGNRALDYEGQVNISTSTNFGNWGVNTGTNALTNVVVDGGDASYEFDTADDGVVILDFSHASSGTVNINLVDEVIALSVDGVIVEEGAADPNLEVGSCLAAISERVCSVGGNGLTISLPITAQNPDTNLQGRMVVVATSHEGDGVVNGVSFNGALPANEMQLLILSELDEGSTTDNYTTLWGMNELLLPTPVTTTSYDVVVDTTDTSTAVCAFFLTGVEQTFPAEDLGTPNDGQINQTSSPDDFLYTATTTVTTTENNALILSIVGMGSPGDTISVNPSPPMLNFDPQPSDPAGGGFGGASGNAPNAAAITISQEITNVQMYRHTHIVAAFNPLISGPPVAEGFEPVVLFKTYSGNISYRAIGASFQTSPNTSNTCDMIPGNSVSTTLTLPDAANADTSASGGFFSGMDEFDSDVRQAWLYWFASGSHDVGTISGSGGYPNNATIADFDNVRFATPIGSQVVTADDVFLIENVGSDSNADYYVGYKDVTLLMPGTNNETPAPDQDPNGTYTVSEMEIDSGEPWLGRGSCAGGWALVVVYDNPYEQLRVINLFHGFQPFQNSSFTLVPRNFRMAERDPDTRRPNGQVTHITVEGDATNSGVGEGLTLQETPGDFDPLDFNTLVTDFNQLTEEFNSTITRPIYTLQDPDPAGTGLPGEYFYLFQPNAPVGDDPITGNPSNGYELDFPSNFFPGNPPGPAETQYSTSYGVDIDTHYIDGDTAADLLWEFANPLTPAEEITTRYSADGDLVLLVSEIISVTNADIADIEVTVSEADVRYKVNTVGAQYNFEVKNNGSGASIYGTATGTIELVGEVPAGMTLTAVNGTGWICANTATAFTCTIDLPGPFPLGVGTTPLELVTATVSIAGPPGNFPSANNNAKIIARVQHKSDSGLCFGGTIGELPTPTDACRPVEFDNVNDLSGGALDINDLEDKTGSNNNVHSIESNVEGVRTDLSVVKSVTTILEEGSIDSALYTITVTNNGLDDITSALIADTITIVDTEPAGVNFDSASGSGGTNGDGGWSCTVGVPTPDELRCVFDDAPDNNLASGASTVITVIGDVTGSSPTAVTNTVQVTAGPYNFDLVPGNNTFFTTDNISSAPAAVTDRFLLSVSATGDVDLGSGAGELVDFNKGDIVLYDPVTDAAELFIGVDNTPEYAVKDPNAIHLLPNGQVVLSSNEDGNEIGTTDLMFDKDDIVLFDKLTNTATLLFDGSTLITGSNLNIDAVYVLPDGRIVFSTAESASGNKFGGGTETWSDSDLVLYDPADDTFLVYLEAEDDNVFDAVDAQVDAAYIRIDPADATTVLDTFVVSSAVQGTVLGDNNVTFGRDDVAEIEITGGTPAVPTGATGTNLFNGGIPTGVFNTGDSNLTLNALHLIEPAHLGHYEISEVVAGNACTPARVRIRKHLGTSHDLDTAYTGSIVISTDSMPVNGIWVLDTGQGTLDNSYGGSSDNGQALYTFFDDGVGGSADDDGEVILTLDVTQSPEVTDSVNLTVTNGFTVDGDTADNPFEFNLVSTDVDYRDDFEVAGYTNSDGSAGWSDAWTEIDAFDGVTPTSGNGLTTGNIQMTGGKLRLTSNNDTDAGSIDPSIARPAGPGFFDYNEPVLIKFDYGYQSVTNSGDEIELQISGDGVTYITVQTYDSLDGTSVSDVDETIDISANIIPTGVAGPTEVLVDDANPNLYVRWAVTEGYVLGTFTVDNFQVTTSTTDCNTGGLIHYHIDIPATGLACVTSNVTITGHDAGHNDVPIPNGTFLNLTTSNGSGSWVNTIGTGTLIDTNGITDGQGTYELTGGDETSIQLQFNYTDPTPIIDGGDGPAVSINLTDGARSEVQDGAHDPTSTFSEAGIVFYDQDSGNLSTTLPFQIAGKPSLTAPASGNVTLQIVRSTLPVAGENAAAACESLVDDMDIVTITLAGLCIDPTGCDAGASSVMTIVDSNAVAQDVPVFSSPTANPEQQVSATDLTLQFSDLGLAIGTVPGPEQNIGAPLNFMYPNSGTISLHAEYEIPLDNDIAGTLSGDTINGASETFVVRPFGFDIDFDSAGNLSNDRGAAADLSLAADANGPAFARAGVGFNATVSAVLWEQGDDVELVDGTAGNDGIPDFEADLSNNLVATNFGDEAVDNNTVEISVFTTDPTNGGAANPGVPTGVTGTMVIVDGSSDIFQGFSSGVSGPQLIAINEVGIFDLGAELVDDNINRRAINYYDQDFNNYVAVEGVAGGARNVGRIYPNNFELISSSFGPRSNQEMVCAMASPFTYMGEDFTINLTLQAENFQGTALQNYFGGFAKLNSFDELDIHAIIDVVGGADVDLDTDMRIVRSTFPDEFGSLTVSGTDNWSAGQILLSGDLRIDRQASGASEAPLENVKISINPTDNNINDGGVDDLVTSNDVLLDVLDVELDDGAPDVDPFEIDAVTGPFLFAEIARHEFRYGRLIVENAFGSESEDLEIGIRIEYFDGNDFVVNAADSCTAITQTNGAEELTYVTGTYEDAGADFIPPLDPFVDGVTVIEGAPGTDVTVTVSAGQSDFEAASDTDLTNDSDRPFFTTAPDPEAVGRVLVELDLDPNDDNSPSSLFFLEYDWRGGAGEGIGDYAGDLFDEEPDGINFDDNPRAIIEFGSYRGHDRVINWQEIYIGPTSP